MTWASMAGSTASKPFCLSSPVREEKSKYVDLKKRYANSKSSQLLHDIYNKSGKVANNLKSDNSLDLHMSYPAQAEADVRSGLKSWWSEEMKCREVGCGKMNSQQATNVGSFTIITGSGAHSKNGVCVMKKITKKMLDQGRYMRRAAH